MRSEIAPPRARREPHETRIHGECLVDDYFWLRQRGDAEVLSYLEAENAYTEECCAHTAALREALFEEMKARIKETDLSVPTLIDDWFYYTRTEKGQQYPIYCRKQGSLEAEEQVLVDLNELAGEGGFLRMGVFEPSPDHRLLAYSLDREGDERYTVRIKELDTGDHLADEIVDTYYSLEWAEDGRHLFYTTLDAAHRPYKVFRHELGSGAADDEVFHEPDERFFVNLGKTRSKRFLFVHLESHTTSEVHLLEASRPKESFRCFHPRTPGVEYSVAHHTDALYILTNDAAVNFRVLKTPVHDWSPSSWEEVVAHDPEAKIDGVHLFRDYRVISKRRDALRVFDVYGFASGASHEIEMAESVYSASLGRNPNFESRLLRFEYTSLITPRTVYDYDLESREKTQLKQQEVLGNYDPARYRTERLWATSPDGARVPISIVYREDFARDGKGPLLLYGYGSYGITVDPSFSSVRLSLLDRGFAFAIAHVRGGGALGRPWYESGKLGAKQNTFTDFIAAAEHLVAEKWTSPERLAISGGSAGGLLMGAVVNQRPELFGAVVADVPFVDVINTMLDPTLPLTIIEYEEWGNPEHEGAFRTMRAYSPYDNVRAQDYPPMLVQAGLNDPRVQYWEPAKWVARLRATRTGDSLLLLKTNMGAGHAGASGRYDALEETAFEYAFLLDQLGAS